MQFVACVWLAGGAENSSLELSDRRLWLVWDVFGRFPWETVNGQETNHLILKDQSTGAFSKHSNGLLHRAGLSVCVQENRRDKEGAASCAPTLSESTENPESKAENCLDV